MHAVNNLKISLTTARANGDLLPFFCGMAVSIPFMLNFVVGGNSYRVSVGMLVFIALLLPAILGCRSPVNFPRTWLALFLAFLVWGLFVIAISEPSDNSFKGLFSFLYQLFLFSHVFVGNRLLRSYNSVVTLTSGIVLMMALTGIFVLLQFDLFQSLDNLLQLKSHYMNCGDSYESGQLLEGIFGWPNCFATFLAVCILFAFHLSVISQTLWQKTVFTIVTLELITLIIITFSRTGWITLFIAILSFIVFRMQPKRIVKKLSVVLPVLLLLYWLTGYYGQLLMGNLTNLVSLFIRLDFFAKVLAINDPASYFIGNGFLSADALFVGRGDSVIDHVISAHNDYMSILLRVGLPGLMLYIGLLSICFRKTLRGTKINSIPGMQRFLCLWAGVSLAFFASGFTQESMRFWPISGTFFLISGGIMGMLGEDNKREHHSRLQYLETRS